MTTHTKSNRTRMLALAATALLTSASCAKHDAPVADTTAGRALAPADTSASSTALMTPVRGTIAAVTDTALTITTATGPQQIHIVAPLRVYTRTTSDLAHVTPNAFVGITSVKQPNGSERATEIHIFPEELRGTGEGSRMMDQAAGSRMTNGAVSPSSRMTNGSVSSTGGGTTYTVQYQGGTQTIEIPAGVTVTSIVPAQTKLAAGANVIVLASTGPDGRLSASTVMRADPPTK
ncbi:MAG TPA: hypothetical protein VGG78_00895 [Gemmatimonadaceae bacterium]